MCHVNFPDGKVIVFTYLHLLFLLIYLIKEVVRFNVNDEFLNESWL